MADPSGSNYVQVQSAEHFQTLLSADLNRVSLINFWATFAEPCKQMNEVARELARKYPKLLVLEVEAESLPDISESFDIESVPAFLVLKGHTLLARIVGADASALNQAVITHLPAQSSINPQSHTEKAPAAASEVTEKTETQEELNQRLKALLNHDAVMLFMKGSPDAPRCGFSRKIVALLRDNNIQFSHFDILTDDAVRQGLKVFNNWPTYPQLIVKGELVGGLDVVQEMVENGEFQEILS